jgi:hypothetical protein
MPFPHYVLRRRGGCWGVWFGDRIICGQPRPIQAPVAHPAPQKPSCPWTLVGIHLDGAMREGSTSVGLAPRGQEWE